MTVRTAFFSLCLATVTLVACASPVPADQARASGRTVRLYKGGLDFPVDMAWVRGTRTMFFTEKNTGRIRVLKGRNLLSRPCAHLSVDSSGERGTLGIVLSPHFKRNHHLYVYYTNASPLENRVIRFTVHHNRCRRGRNIVKGIAASSEGYHNGGQLEFVGGKLFVSVGEAHNADNAQNTGNRLGKVLRYNPDGSVPRGNPFGRHDPVWSYGHRNPFGLTHQPGTHRLFETENGPSCDDEFNRIVKGRNYGWGNNYQCGTAGVGPNPKPPLRRWSQTIVPTDPWWYRGRLGALNGSVYVGDYGGGRLHRLVLNRKGTKVIADRIVYDDSGSIIDVTKGPGGWLYYSTTDSIKRIVSQ